MKCGRMDGHWIGHAQYRFAQRGCQRHPPHQFNWVAYSLSDDGRVDGSADKKVLFKGDPLGRRRNFC